jgi:hypothetical protein
MTPSQQQFRPSHRRRPAAADGLTAKALAQLGAPGAVPDRILQCEALKSCLYGWLSKYVWATPKNWLKVGACSC